MKLTVFNGSPRGEKSSTKLLMEQFLDGFMANDGNSHEVFYLNRVKDGDRFVEAFKEAENVILAFPLYHDSMPAMVKTFIEALEPLCGREGNPNIGFMVQSGFPEAVHSRYVEKYLEKLTRRLGCRYLGTMVKGGGNRIDEQPKRMARKVYESFYELGSIFGQTGKLDERMVAKLAAPEKITGFTRFMFRLVLKTPLAYMNWDKQLKANKAYEKRFAKPYTS